MKKGFDARDIANVLGALIFLVLGFVGLWAVKNLLDINGEAVYISLLIMPIFIYLAYSGRLTGLKGPGGLEANFASVARQSVEEAARTEPISTEDAQPINKGSPADLTSQLIGLDPSKFIMLTLKAGSRAIYSRADLIQYLDALSQYRHFKLVVILDSEGKFVAHVPPATLKQMLQGGAIGTQFVDDINNGRVSALKRYPGVLTDATVYTSSTNLDALKQMADKNLEALVVIDRDRRVQGVLGRELVLSKLVAALAT
jgi:hypothetical protein